MNEDVMKAVEETGTEMFDLAPTEATTDWKAVAAVYGGGLVTGIILSKVLKPVGGLIMKGVNKLRGKVTKEDFKIVDVEPEESEEVQESAEEE